MGTVELRRGRDRGRTVGAGRDTAHSFSFGAHYDPDNTSFGLLLAHNEDVLQPRAGYDEHPHARLDIVSWVVSGRLGHVDPVGGTNSVGPGQVQYLGTGRGIVHSERNAADEPVRYVQMWLPSERDEPSYQWADLNDALDRDRSGWTPVASGLARHRGLAPIELSQAGAGLSAVRLGPGGSIGLVSAPLVHLFVTRGEVSLEGPAGLEGSAGSVGSAAPRRGARLGAGDAVRLTDPAAITLRTDTGCELLAWEMLSGLD
ncbi:pirin family protein [Jatrophihabitans telluris]|uniref:Pirin family protein n=1 Tax=Jatrophihabitans telluris TaxID=2038343 RepID=A0ABY4QW39_9ACTN|nr:pirin family protein [Jatrophihabitans telluris]UQX87312.1 pirin family protein [Jatrophihabitans telluris]